MVVAENDFDDFAFTGHEPGGMVAAENDFDDFPFTGREPGVMVIAENDFDEFSFAVWTRTWRHRCSRNDFRWFCFLLDANLTSPGCSYAINEYFAHALARPSFPC